MPTQSTGKSLRLRRILRRGRAVVVAMDHGNAAGAVRGLEKPAEVVRAVAPAGADAILVTPGILEQVCEHVGELAILLRIDGCVSPLGGGPMKLFHDVEQAVAMGVDAVVMNATLGAPHEGEELEKVGSIASEGRSWGMPVVAEILSQRMMDNHMDMSGSGDGELPANIGDDHHPRMQDRRRTRGRPDQDPVLRQHGRVPHERGRLRAARAGGWRTASLRGPRRHSRNR